MNLEPKDILAWKVAKSYAAIEAKLCGKEVDIEGYYQSALELVNQPGGRQYYEKFYRDSSRLNSKKARRKKAQVIDFTPQV